MISIRQISLTIKTLPREFPVLFAQRMILSAFLLAVLCILSIVLYSSGKYNKLRFVSSIALSAYVVILLYFTVLGRYSHPEYEYQIYFFTSYRWLFNHNGEQLLRQLLINLFMLVPVGFLLPIIIQAEHKYLITMALSLLLTVFIETMQLIMKCGSFEIDDIINNFIGAVLGMLLYMLFNRIIQKQKGKHYE